MSKWPFIAVILCLLLIYIFISLHGNNNNNNKYIKYYNFTSVSGIVYDSIGEDHVASISLQCEDPQLSEYTGFFDITYKVSQNFAYNFSFPFTAYINNSNIIILFYKGNSVVDRLYGNIADSTLVLNFSYRNIQGNNIDTSLLFVPGTIGLFNKSLIDMLGSDTVVEESDI